MSSLVDAEAKVSSASAAPQNPPDAKAQDAKAQDAKAQDAAEDNNPDAEVSGDEPTGKRRKVAQTCDELVIRETSFKVQVPHNLKKFDNNRSCFVCLEALKPEHEADEVTICTTKVRTCANVCGR